MPKDDDLRLKPRSWLELRRQNVHQKLQDIPQKGRLLNRKRPASPD
jgi:hypothetical protein